MAQDLMWADAEDIGIRLQEEHPDLESFDRAVYGFTYLDCGVT